MLAHSADYSYRAALHARQRHPRLETTAFAAALLAVARSIRKGINSLVVAPLVAAVRALQDNLLVPIANGLRLLAAALIQLVGMLVRSLVEVTSSVVAGLSGFVRVSRVSCRECSGCSARDLCE